MAIGPDTAEKAPKAVKANNSVSRRDAHFGIGLNGLDYCLSNLDIRKPTAKVLKLANHRGGIP